MNKRHLDRQISAHFDQYRLVLVLLGSRQVGKTTLVKRLFPDAEYLLVDNEPVRRILESYDIESYKTLIPPGIEEVVIDEIHLLKDPGRAVKVLYDQREDLRIVITGSSSFHIKNKTSESLAGRKIDYHIYPLTFSEFLVQKGIEKSFNYNILTNITEAPTSSFKAKMYRFDISVLLETMLIYGQYPFLVEHANDHRYLLNFVDSLIFKDILELNLIENKRLASDMLRLLAHQIGSVINYSELASSLSADHRTIKRYIEIFEQSYILYRLYPYARNKRTEIVKSPKIYFYDTGVRNALIEDFSGLNVRNDKGALFENFIIGEVIKQNSYSEALYKMHYWRTKQGSEMDLVLEKPNELIAVEIKYNKRKVNRAFKNNYPDAVQRIITSSDFY
ncbi:MAG: ATP-binding protein [Kiritimatiellae bacterium]|jgi:predicted AAA+ superfamily ATPase|nr:ATP-binding protein [Kiritimatiellia bacterium]